MIKMIQELMDFAKETAKSAGNILKQGFETEFEISEKVGKNNLVTEYDFKSEQYIISKINSKYPDHQVLAEESGYSAERNTDKPLWIIDPLDGTVNFAHGIPIYSVSIAVEINKEIVAGAIYQPMLEESFYAGKNLGAFYNSKPIKVSKQSDIHKSLLVTGFPYNINDNPYNTLQTFNEIIQNGSPVRRLGSAAIDLAYVAKGRFEGFWEVKLQPWDVAAGILILREAGGTVINYEGNDFSLEDKTIIATNGLIEQDLLKFIRKSYVD